MKSSNCKKICSKLYILWKTILFNHLIFLIVFSDASRDEVRLSHYSEPQMFDIMRNRSSLTFVFPAEKGVCDKLCESRSAFLMQICDNDFVCTANETNNSKKECKEPEMCQLCHLSIKCDSSESSEKNESEIESNINEELEDSKNNETVTERILDDIEKSDKRSNNVVMLEKFDMNVITQEMMVVSKQGNKSFTFSDSDRGRVQQDCRCNKSLLHVCTFRTQCTATLLCRDNCTCNLDLVCSSLSAKTENVINNDYVNEEEEESDHYLKRNFHIILDATRCSNLCNDEKHLLHGICPQSHKQVGSCSTSSQKCKREQCRCDVSVGCHLNQTSTKSTTVVQSSSTTSLSLAPHRLSLSRSSRLGGAFCRDAASKSVCRQMSRAKCDEKRGKVCVDDHAATCSTLFRDNAEKKCCLRITCLLHNQVKGEKLSP